MTMPEGPCDFADAELLGAEATADYCYAHQDFCAKAKVPIGTPPQRPIKRIDIKEFREFGYLQEANRLFLHPLGLALEVVVEDEEPEMRESLQKFFDEVPDGPDHIDVALALLAKYGIKPGEERLGGIWDDRDDPEGIAFGDPMPGLIPKAMRVSKVWAEREAARRDALGWFVQPADEPLPLLNDGSEPDDGEG
jgi:hypothetical protein